MKLGVVGRNNIPVVSGSNLSELISSHTLHGLVVGGLIVLDGDLSSHASHGVDSTLVTGLDQEFNLLQ